MRSTMRRRGRQVRPACPYVRTYLVKHPDQQNLAPEQERADLFGTSSD